MQRCIASDETSCSAIKRGSGLFHLPAETRAGSGLSRHSAASRCRKVFLRLPASPEVAGGLTACSSWPTAPVRFPSVFDIQPVPGMAIFMVSQQVLPNTTDRALVVMSLSVTAIFPATDFLLPLSRGFCHRRPMVAAGTMTMVPAICRAGCGKSENVQCLEKIRDIGAELRIIRCSGCSSLWNNPDCLPGDSQLCNHTWRSRFNNFDPPVTLTLEDPEFYLEKLGEYSGSGKD